MKTKLIPETTRKMPPISLVEATEALMQKHMDKANGRDIKTKWDSYSALRRLVVEMRHEILKLRREAND